MGCTASAELSNLTKSFLVTKDSIKKPEDGLEKAISSESKSSIENDLKSSSILTMKSGNLIIEQKQMITTEELKRKNHNKTTIGAMIAFPSKTGSKSRILDSPAPFRKTPKGIATTPQKLRLRKENPFASPHSKRSTFPLQESEEDSMINVDFKSLKTPNG